MSSAVAEAALVSKHVGLALVVGSPEACEKARGRTKRLIQVGHFGKEAVDSSRR